MAGFIVRRLLSLTIVALTVGIGAFTLVQITPGDPAAYFLGDDPRPGDLERIRANLGLDQPVPVQFVRWFGGVLRGDLGLTFRTGRPVVEVFFERLPATLFLTISSTIIAALVGIPFGVIAALKQNSWVDRLATFLVLIGLATPNFWLGLMLILLFSVTLGWLPVQGFVNPLDDPILALRHVLLPAIALGLNGASLIARMARSSMLEVLRQDYVTVARAKGLAERLVIFKHALKPAMNPVLTVLGLSVVTFLSKTVIVEIVFNYNGIGYMVVNAVLRRDYPLIQGSLILIAALTIIVNLIVDIFYAVLDPRIRYDEGT